MKDHKCVEQGVVQFDLGSYANPVWKLVSDELLEHEAWDEHDLQFQYCCYPGAGATVDTDTHEDFFQEFHHHQGHRYLQDGIADPFPDATSDGAPRSDECRHSRLVNVVGYFDGTWWCIAPRGCRRCRHRG